MKKRISMRRIIGRRSYNTKELSELLGIHPQTVREWRSSGMTPINLGDHQALYLGSEVRRFYGNREDARKITLGHDEFYCFSCKRGVLANKVIPIDQKAKLGTGLSSMRYEGECQLCGHKVCRFFTKPANISAEGEGINIDHLSPLYHSYSSGKDNHVKEDRNSPEK